MTHKSLYAITLSLLASSLIAQDASAPADAKTPVFDNHKQVVEMIRKQKKYAAKHKFTTSAGASFTTFQDKSSVTPLKGKTKSGFISLGYQFTPKVSANVAVIRSKTSEADKDGALVAKSTDDTLATSIDYKLLSWLTVSGSFKQKNGTIAITMPQETNQYARSKNVYRTPGLALKMMFPVSKQVFVLPDVGFSRTYMYNKAYTDNANIAQPKKTLIMDQASIGTKVGYMHNPMIIPYVSLGYSKATRYNAPLKSKSSYRVGAGIIGMGGIVVFDWTRSRAFKSITSNTFTLNLTAKF